MLFCVCKSFLKTLHTIPIEVSGHLHMSRKHFNLLYSAIQELLWHRFLPSLVEGMVLAVLDVLYLPIQFPVHPLLPVLCPIDPFHALSCPWLSVGFIQWEALAAGAGSMGEKFKVFLFLGNLPNSCQAAFSVELFSLGFSNSATFKLFRPRGGNGCPENYLLHKPHPRLHTESFSLNCLQLAGFNMFSVSFQHSNNKMLIADC